MERQGSFTEPFPPGSPVTSPLLGADELSPTLEINNAQIRNGN
jgi:hypothetical protein